jgi:hypothetical protein
LTGHQQRPGDLTLERLWRVLVVGTIPAVPTATAIGTRLV